MVPKFIAKIEALKISFSQWIAAFLGVVFIRFFLETFSSPTPSFPAAPDILALVHYALFYLAILLSLSLLLRTIICDIGSVTKILLFGFPVIWLPPLIDLAWSRGSGYGMAYILAGGSSLWVRFWTFGGSYVLGGITPGIKIEVALIVCGIFAYVFLKTKKFWQAILISVLAYAVLFFYLALPSFVIAAAGAPGFAPVSSFITLFSASHMVENFIPPTVQLSYGRALETVFNLGMAHILYLLDTALILGWFLAYRALLVIAFLKNIRFLRLAHYTLMLCFGVLVAVVAQGVHLFRSWADVIAFTVLLFSYVCAWLFAVGTNDLADVAIDTVSNADRPLIANTLSVAEVKQGNLFFLAWLAIGGFIGGYWLFFTLAVFTAAYYVYSASPLRLKRIPLIASFLISLACLSAAMSGFYFVGSSKFIFDFPFRIALLIVTCFTLGVNMKDIKDIVGDRLVGIPTIPVIFGEKRGKAIVGGLLAAAFLAVPIIMGLKVLFWPSLAAATCGYVFINAKHYREWRIFALYFAYMASVAIALMLAWK